MLRFTIDHGQHFLLNATYKFELISWKWDLQKSNLQRK